MKQILVSLDGRNLKISDFNRAEWMQFDEKHQEYCRFRNGHANGSVSPMLIGERVAFGGCSLSAHLVRILLRQSRSPEEYKDEPLNEKIDVYSLGNLLVRRKQVVDVTKYVSPN